MAATGRLLVGLSLCHVLMGCAQHMSVSPPPPRRLPPAISVLDATIEAPYQCKHQSGECRVEVKVRDRKAGDPADFACAAYVDYKKIRTASGKPLYFDLKLVSGPDRGFRFWGSGLYFEPAKPSPPADESYPVGLQQADKVAMWQGGPKKTAHGGGHGYDFLPWVYYTDSKGELQSCWGADPKIANEN